LFIVLKLKYNNTRFMFYLFVEYWFMHGGFVTGANADSVN